MILFTHMIALSISPYINLIESSKDRKVIRHISEQSSIVIVGAVQRLLFLSK